MPTTYTGSGNTFLGYTVSIVLSALGVTALPAVSLTGTNGGIAPDVDHVIDSEVFCSIADNVSVKPETATGNRSAKFIHDFLTANKEQFRRAFIYGFRNQEDTFLISSGSVTFRGTLENDGKFSQIELIDSTVISDAANQATLEAVKSLSFPAATTGSITVMFTIDLQVRTINK